MDTAKTQQAKGSDNQGHAVPMHGSYQDRDDANDIDSKIEAKGCKEAMEKLNECLSSNPNGKRDWAKCQIEVKELKNCHNKAGTSS